MRGIVYLQSTHQMAATASPGEAEARSLELDTGLLHVWQVSKHLDHVLPPSRGAVLEAKQPGPELALRRGGSGIGCT